MLELSGRDTPLLQGPQVKGVPGCGGDDEVSGDSILEDLDAFIRAQTTSAAPEFRAWLSRTIPEYEQWLARIVRPAP